VRGSALCRGWSRHRTQTGGPSSAVRATSPDPARSASRSDSTESEIPPIARESSRKPAGPLLRTPRTTPFQRLPRNSNALASAASPRTHSSDSEAGSWPGLGVVPQVRCSTPTTSCSPPAPRTRSRPRRKSPTSPPPGARHREAHEALLAADRALIVGAGPAGLELAGEIKAFYPEQARDDRRRR
jgi:hypothetical protein